MRKERSAVAAFGISVIQSGISIAAGHTTGIRTHPKRTSVVVRQGSGLGPQGPAVRPVAIAKAGGDANRSDRTTRDQGHGNEGEPFQLERRRLTRASSWCARPAVGRMAKSLQTARFHVEQATECRVLLLFSKTIHKWCRGSSWRRPRCDGYIQRGLESNHRLNARSRREHCQRTMRTTT